VLSSQAITGKTTSRLYYPPLPHVNVTDNDNVVRVMLDHTSHGSMYRTVTEGQTVILDCSQLLNVYRHGIKGDAEDHIYYWTRGKITMADSPQLTIKAGQSTRGAYRCIAVAPARGEAHIIVLTKTIRLTVESESLINTDNVRLLPILLL